MSSDIIQLAIDSLPILTQHEVASLDEDACPICLVPFLALNDESVTKLSGCGHVFCRKDLSEWIRGHHGSCPTCRHTFLNVKPPSESDDESSDGGEYLPPSDDFEDEDDGFLDTDGFTDADAEDVVPDNMEPFNDAWDDDIALMDDVCEDIETDFDDVDEEAGLHEYITNPRCGP